MNPEARVKEGTGTENRESFMNRFRHKITPRDLEKLDFAYELAKYGHRNQIRDSGARYFEHVRATALILVDELGITDAEMIISALLHDMLEDNFLLNPIRIKLTFGERVARIVSVITKPKRGDARFSSDSERHQWYFLQLNVGDVDSKIVKLADRLHNMRALNCCAPEKQKRKIEETKNIYLPFIDDVAKDCPEIAEYFKEEFQKTLNALEKSPAN